MNRFSKSDATDFYRSIPLIENDTVLFLFGEIDIRVWAIKKMVENYLTMEESVKIISDRFINFSTCFLTTCSVRAALIVFLP